MEIHLALQRIAASATLSCGELGEPFRGYPTPICSLDGTDSGISTRLGVSEMATVERPQESHTRNRARKSGNIFRRRNKLKSPDSGIAYARVDKASRLLRTRFSVRDFFALPNIRSTRRLPKIYRTPTDDVTTMN